VAGLSLISARRIAAFNAARNVARIRTQRRRRDRCTQRLMLADDRGEHRLHLIHRQIG
jgi:hypothetical protein